MDLLTQNASRNFVRGRTGRPDRGQDGAFPVSQPFPQSLKSLNYENIVLIPGGSQNLCFIKEVVKEETDYLAIWRYSEPRHKRQRCQFWQDWAAPATSSVGCTAELMSVTQPNWTDLSLPHPATDDGQ